MTEGQGLAAASARAAGADAVSSPGPIPPGQSPAPEPPPGRPEGGQQDAGRPDAGRRDAGRPEAGRHRRVDARRLEAALLELRRRVVDVSLVFETEGAVAIREERRKLLSQIDDYLLPRVRQSGAPILVALVGSTGAGKSTLVNSIVGVQVSNTGIRRPTTNSPVLACHPGRRGLVRGERVPAHGAPGPPGGAGPVRPRWPAGARRERGHAEGCRAARHPGHRLGGGGAPGVRPSVPGRLGPVAVHDHGEPLCGCGRVGAAGIRQGTGRGAGHRAVPGAADPAAPS